MCVCVCVKISDGQRAQHMVSKHAFPRGFRFDGRKSKSAARRRKRKNMRDWKKLSPLCAEVDENNTGGYGGRAPGQGGHHEDTDEETMQDVNAPESIRIASADIDMGMTAMSIDNDDDDGSIRDKGTDGSAHHHASAVFFGRRRRAPGLIMRPKR